MVCKFAPTPEGRRPEGCHIAAAAGRGQYRQCEQLGELIAPQETITSLFARTVLALPTRSDIPRHRPIVFNQDAVDRPP